LNRQSLLPKCTRFGVLAVSILHRCFTIRIIFAITIANSTLNKFMCDAILIPSRRPTTYKTRSDAVTTYEHSFLRFTRAAPIRNNVWGTYVCRSVRVHLVATGKQEVPWWCNSKSRRTHAHTHTKRQFESETRAISQCIGACMNHSRQFDPWAFP